MKMPYSELDSFIQKFKQLWHSGVNCHLDVHTHAGQAWARLHVQLGHAPGPLHCQLPPHFPPSPRSKNTPSRQRRRARRAAERNEKAEEASKKVAEKEQSTSTIDSEAENAKKISSDVVADAVEASTGSIIRREVTDEVCSDDTYKDSEPEEKDTIGETSFRCFQCRMLFLPDSHVDGQPIKDYEKCKSHIGVLKCTKCSFVLVGLAKIRCHRGVCTGSA